MIMSHRGTEGEPIVGQVPMGKATPKVLDAMELEYFNPKNPTDAKGIISKSWDLSVDKGSPISILLDINYW